MAKRRKGEDGKVIIDLTDDDEFAYPEALFVSLYRPRHFTAVTVQRISNERVSASQYQCHVPPADAPLETLILRFSPSPRRLVEQLVIPTNDCGTTYPYIKTLGGFVGFIISIHGLPSFLVHTETLYDRCTAIAKSRQQSHVTLYKKLPGSLRRKVVELAFGF